MDRERKVRFVAGVVLGFLGSAEGWIAVILTMRRNLDSVSFVALWIPVVLFAVLGFALRGWGLLGAVIGALAAVPLVFWLTPWLNPDLGEAGADSIGWGIPVELVVWMVPAGLIGWGIGRLVPALGRARH